MKKITYADLECALCMEKEVVCSSVKTVIKKGRYLVYSYETIIAVKENSKYTVKYPLQLRRGHLFTTPSLTLLVPRTKGAFALCLRRVRPCR